MNITGGGEHRCEVSLVAFNKKEVTLTLPVLTEAKITRLQEKRIAYVDYKLKIKNLTTSKEQSFGKLRKLPGSKTFTVSTEMIPGAAADRFHLEVILTGVNQGFHEIKKIGQTGLQSPVNLLKYKPNAIRITGRWFIYFHRTCFLKAEVF